MYRYVFPVRVALCVSQLYLWARVCAVTVGRIRECFMASQRDTLDGDTSSTLFLSLAPQLLPAATPPPLSLLFSSISSSLSHAVFKSPLSFCLFPYPSSPIILSHIASYPHKSPTLPVRAPPPSTVSLASYPSPSLSPASPLSLCLSNPPSPHSRALGVIMMHSATVFISASSPEWLCLYLNIKKIKIFFWRGGGLQKEKGISTGKACSSCLPLDLDKQETQL